MPRHPTSMRKGAMSSIDFEGIATAQAYGRAIRRQALDADAAMHEANAIIARKNDLLCELERRIQDLEHALARERAHSAGLTAQGRAARAALAQGTGASLLARTGRTYDHAPQDALHVIYEKAFDARAKELGLVPGPELRVYVR